MSDTTDQIDLKGLAAALEGAGYSDVRIRSDLIGGIPLRLMLITDEVAIHVTDDGQVFARSESYQWARISVPGRHGVLTALGIIAQFTQETP